MIGPSPLFDWRTIIISQEISPFDLSISVSILIPCDSAYFLFLQTHIFPYSFARGRIILS
jgi:hypothetical protein